MQFGKNVGFRLDFIWGGGICIIAFIQVFSVTKKRPTFGCLFDMTTCNCNKYMNFKKKLQASGEHFASIGCRKIEKKSPWSSLISFYIKLMNKYSNFIDSLSQISITNDENLLFASVFEIWNVWTRFFRIYLPIGIHQNGNVRRAIRKTQNTQ